MRTYESIFIAPSEIEAPALEALNEKVAGIVKNGGGEVLKIEDWGVKRLAYEVNDQTNGHYVFMKISCLPNTLSEMNREYRLNPQILKFMTVVEKPPRKKPEPPPEVEKEATLGEPE